MASEFKPGDKVAFLNNQGGGKVISLLEGDQVLIELDEGFEIPVNKGEIVKERDFIEGEEPEEPKPEAEKAKSTAEPKGEPGCFLAFDQSKGENTRDLYIINNTANILYFAIYEQKGKGGEVFNGLSSGALATGQTQMINRYNVQAFDDWAPLVIQALFFTEKAAQVPAPIHYTFKPRARAFFNAVRTAPVLACSAHVFRLDTPEAQVTEEAAQVSEAAEEKPVEVPANEEAGIQMERPPEVIDLHIDRLVPDYKKMERDAILEYQMNYFETVLDKAIAHAYKKMIFIHGIGNGVLRERIHQLLKKKTDIRSFKEADPQKYGYGATEVRIQQEN